MSWNRKDAKGNLKPLKDDYLKKHDVNIPNKDFGKIPLRIDSKTIVLVKKSTNLDEYKKKFIEKLEKYKHLY